MDKDKEKVRKKKNRGGITPPLLHFSAPKQ
jgi:hypothetical protein